MRRNIESRSPNVLLRLYKSIVRPHLEYAVQAWAPWMKKDIELVESVQRRFTRMITGMQDLSYEERLARLRLRSLEARRRRGDAIQTLKILKRIDHVDPENFFEVDTQGRSRGHQLKLRKQYCRLDVRKHFYTQRCIDTWNKLPPSAIEAATVLQFKKNITKEAAFKGY